MSEPLSVRMYVMGADLPGNNARSALGTATFNYLLAGFAVWFINRARLRHRCRAGCHFWRGRSFG